MIKSFFNNVGKSFEKIEKTFSNITSIVNQVSDATKEMLSKADITSEDITNVAAISEENSAAAEEVSAATEKQTASMHEIGETANKLDELVVKLKSEVDRFKI